MRVQFGSVARPSYQDRGAQSVALTVDTGATAPHSETSRFLYDVPAGYKGYLEFLELQIRRALATATYGRAVLEVRRSQGATVHTLARLEHLSGLAESVERLVLGNIFIPEGWRLQIVSYDTSTGGSIYYVALGSLLIFMA